MESEVSKMLRWGGKGSVHLCKGHLSPEVGTTWILPVEIKEAISMSLSVVISPGRDRNSPLETGNVLTGPSPNDVCLFQSPVQECFAFSRP